MSSSSPTPSSVTFDHVLWWHHIGSVTVSPADGIRFEQFSGEIVQWPWLKIDSKFSAEANVALRLTNGERVELTFPTTTTREEFDSFLDICRDMNAIDRARNSKRLSFIMESASEDDSDYETDEEETIDLSGRPSVAGGVRSVSRGGGASVASLSRYSGGLAKQDPLNTAPVYGRGRSLAQLSLQRHSSHRFIATATDDDDEDEEERGRGHGRSSGNTRIIRQKRNNNISNSTLRRQRSDDIPSDGEDDVIPIIDDSSLRTPASPENSFRDDNNNNHNENRNLNDSSNSGSGPARVVERQSLIYMLFAGCIKSSNDALLRLQKQPSFVRRRSSHHHHHAHHHTAPASSTAHYANIPRPGRIV